MAQDKETDRRQAARKAVGGAIHLRIPTLILAFFLAFVAIAAAYLLGVMSGRYSEPPSPEKTAAVADIPSPKPGDGSEAISAPPKSDVYEQILTPAELEYARVLRRDENTPLTKLKTGAEQDKPGKKEASVLPPSEAEAAKPSLREMLAAEKGEEISDYHFQVAAFKDEKTVDALREKLEGHGFRTLMKRDGKLYLIQVRLRGTAARAAELLGLLGELGLGEPMLLARTPVKS